MKKLFLITSALVLTMAFSVTAFAATPAVDPLTEVNATVTSTILQDNISGAADTASDIKASDAKTFKTKLAPQLTELKALRATAKTNWASLKTLNYTIKSAMTAYKDSLKGLDKAVIKEKVTALKIQLSPVRLQITAIHKEIKAIRAHKLVERTAFKAAVKARDLDCAKVHIEKVITLKKQIIERQHKLMALKSQLLTIIRAASN